MTSAPELVPETNLSPCDAHTHGPAAPDGSASSATGSLASRPQDLYFGDSSTYTFVSNVRSDASNPSPHAAQFPDGPASASSHPPLEDDPGIPSKDLESCLELPERGFADSLVDAYFHQIHRVYPFLHEGRFRAEYELMWKQNPASQKPRLCWYGVLNIVFAHGCDLVDCIPEHQIIQTAAPFLARTKKVVLAQGLKAGSLETVQALLLMCYYLQGITELHECWNFVGMMIRTAISLGLHLNPSSPSLTPLEQELRKRTWWGCVVIDRTLSMKIGRPVTLSAKHVMVDLPLEVDDQYITDDMITPRQPIGCPSATSFFVSTIKLSHIVFNMLKVLYADTSDKSDEQSGQNRSFCAQSSQQYRIISNAVLLDGQLQSWWDRVPSHLTQEPDTAGSKLTQRQRVILKIRYHHIRLIIHRQAFLIYVRQRFDNDLVRGLALALSRVCVDSARKSVELIQKYCSDQKLLAFFYNGYYTFTSMCVLSAVTMMDEGSREGLIEKHDESLRQVGIKHLQHASETSMLAAKYVAILRRLNPSHDSDKSIFTPRHRGQSSQDQFSSQTSGLSVPLNSYLDRTATQTGQEDASLDLTFTDSYDFLQATGVLEDLNVPAPNTLPFAYMDFR